jgi:hypothetical protein
MDLRSTKGLRTAAGIALTAAMWAAVAPGAARAGEGAGSGQPDAGAARAGTSPAAARAAAAATGPGCAASLPVVVHHPGGAAASLPSGAQLPIACADPTGYETSESTIAAGKDGSLFYSPAHTENTLARSFDQGANWNLTYPPKMQYTSLWNTVDPIVTVDRRTGRLFWLRATGDLRTAPILVDESPFGNQAATAIAYAHGFQVYSSHDDGQTWTTADYQHEFTGDWEKLFVGPPRPASTGAPQPAGYPDVVYMCGNAPFEVSGPGRACYRSLDGGTTFALASYVFPSASAPAVVCPALAGNTGVVDSQGRTFQPQSCEGGTYLAVSEDEGASYAWLPIRGAPPVSVYSGTVQIAVDKADNVYALWVAGDKLELAISRDHGKTWSDPIDATPPGLHKITLPALAADEAGHVGITYYASRDSAATALTAYITQTGDALDAKPLLYSGALNDPAHPIFTAYGGNASPRADYVGGTYDSSGTFWAGVVRQLSAPTSSSNEIATVGYVGHLLLRDKVGLPSNGRCVDRRKFSFTLHHGRHATVVRVDVFVNGRRVLSRRGRNIKRVTIKRLPQGKFVVKIVATQSTGSTLTSTRTYKGCKKTAPTTRAHHHR